MKKTALLTGLILIFSMNIYGLDEGDLSIRIEQVNSSAFPFMEVYFTVSNSEGTVEPNLVQGNFSAFVDGKDTYKFDLLPFQFSDESISFSIILSSSGIMDGEPLSLQKQAIADFFEQVRDREDDLISVYTFGEHVVPVFESQKYNETLMDMVNAVEVHDQQPRLSDAIISVARKHDEISIKRKVIIVMSDGRDIDSQYTSDQFYSILEDKNIPVYTIGIKVLGGNNLFRLDEIAQRTGARYVFAKSVKYISPSFKNITDHILFGYITRFKTKDIPGDDKEHQLHLKLIDKEKSNSVFINFTAYKRIVPWWFKYLILGLVIAGLIVLMIVLIIIRKQQRALMGITTRKCSVCRQRMKDDWDECIFCKYIPPTKKQLKKSKKKKDKKAKKKS